MAEELSGSWRSVTTGFCVGGSDEAFASGGVHGSFDMHSAPRKASGRGEVGNMDGEIDGIAFVVTCASGVDVIGDLGRGLLVVEDGRVSAADGMLDWEAPPMIKRTVS